jgi:hypothetical protein
MTLSTWRSAGGQVALDKVNDIVFGRYQRHRHSDVVVTMSWFVQSQVKILPLGIFKCQKCDFVLIYLLLWTTVSTLTLQSNTLLQFNMAFDNPSTFLLGHLQLKTRLTPSATEQ